MQTPEIEPEDLNEVSSDLTEGMFGEVSYEAESPQKKEFLPWHRPRKQFVRRYQWCEQINKLIMENLALENKQASKLSKLTGQYKANELSGNEPVIHESSRVEKTLKYLGLPGDDLLDLRFFHNEICEPNNIHLKFIGFNTSAKADSPGQTNFNVSYDEVKRMRFVDPFSYVLGDDFCKLVDHHIAWNAVESNGPYDVINLDLCDGFGAHEPQSRQDTYYNAVTKLLGLQSRYNKPWLFLLTTRVGQNDINPNALERFLQIYIENLNESAAFNTESVNSLSIPDEATLREVASTEKGLLDVFLVGLSKWLIKIVSPLTPPWKLEVKSIHGYRVVDSSECEDLISIAFKFIPVQASVIDPSGLADSNPVNVDEGTQAVQAVKRVVKRRDVDQLLGDDAELSTRMEEETALLLESARYDITEYRLWITDGCPNPRSVSRQAG